MSCTLPTPPGTARTISSICFWERSASGSISGVIAWHSATMRFSGTSMYLASPLTATANPTTVGVANNACTLACNPCARIRSITRTASSECPPNSKKLSCRPTRSIFNSSLQIAAIVLSTSPRGASYSRRAYASPAGAGNALRSIFPLAVSGSSSSRT